MARGYTSFGRCDRIRPMNTHPNTRPWLLGLLALQLVSPPFTDTARAEPPNPDVVAQVRDLGSCESLETCEAAQTLVRLGAAAWPGLTAGLDSPEELVRFWTLGVLSEVPQKAARERVTALLKDPKVRVRAAAAYALGALESREDTPALLGALADAEPHVRFAAVVALGRVKDPASVGGLVAALRDKDEEVRGYAAEALGAIGAGGASGPARDGRATAGLVERLEQDMNATVRVRAATALADLADPAVLAPLLRVAGADKDAPVLAAVAYALGRLGDAEALPALRKLASSDSEGVRTYAIDAITRIEKKK